MLPSLVAAELRATLTSFLGTTFALTDDDVRAELERFIADDEHGVFRGPYVRLRLPFRSAADGWRDSLGWTPTNFIPHRHQAQAWARLSSLHQQPQPTVVTTGTGSGKTESFLVPLLDHARRHADVRGIKAIVLYPMNALANDQARRIAALVADHPELADVRVGLYTGDSPATTTMTTTDVIGDRYELRNDPPDILLTNYKMLDMLLLRSEDRRLFDGASTALRYLVLDEFHTYDGAQGTDVAMLLRRLGMALGTLGDDGPLTGITPVATSATLGTGDDSTDALRDFAHTVFGAPFSDDAIIREDRLSPDEWATESTGSVPLLDTIVDALAGYRSHAEIISAAQQVYLGAATDDTRELGRRLRAHPLTRRLVAEARHPRHLDDVAAGVEPGWASRPADARVALGAYLALLSQARDEHGRALLAVDVQLWLREVSRVLRQLDIAPRFSWFEGSAHQQGQALAAIYCRHCGRSGWGAAAKPGGGETITPETVWRGALTDRRRQRAWIYAPGEGAAQDPRVHWVDAETGALARVPSGRHTTEVPVIITPDDDAARGQTCPICGLADGIRFLGSSVATLASAALGQVFASPDIEPEQKKTLVFTDSVQDASHRAGFVESRSYALNRRALLLRAIPEDGCSLDTVGEAVVASAHTQDERFSALPPDLAALPRKPDGTITAFHRFWLEDHPAPDDRAAVVKLLDFHATLEFGLSSRLGRTLEVTGAATAHVHVDGLPGLAADVLAEVESFGGQQSLDDDALTGQLELSGAGTGRELRWARGVLERIRLQGGISHPWFDQFAESGGIRYSIWSGRPRWEGMPAFPRGRAAPSYPTTLTGSDAFATITGAKGWFAQWTSRALGVPAADAHTYLRALLDALTAAGGLTVHAADGGAAVRIWQVPATRVHLARTTGDNPAVLRCTVCASDVPAPEEVRDQLRGAPCMRLLCSGVYAEVTLDPDYYRELYRAGRVRRIVAQEHTSLLKRDERISRETAFKQPVQRADAPNVLTCTPTLELGIDIGDLSMVTLASMPRSTASYLQRVGRAGRLTGSALVLSLLPARPLELRRLAEPLTMIAGDVVPPACYLDAVGILRRQYLASLIDRHARAENPQPPHRAHDVFAAGLGPASYLGRLLLDAREHVEQYVTEFLAGFGDAVSKETAEDLRRWVGALEGDLVPGLERDVERAAQDWQDELAELEARKTALHAAHAELDSAPSRDEAQERDLKRLRGELAAVRKAQSQRRMQYWINALESQGLLPNYALLDDTTQLDIGLWWTDEESGDPDSSEDSYLRGSRTALAELAPGATFYVGGMAIEIDGLDLGGSKNPAHELRRFCPTCGWSAPSSQSIAACPRCADPAAADMGQVIRTLPFRKASAYSSRELAMRDEDRDDRRRTTFDLVATVDADPADIAAAWGLQSYQFGAEFLSRADIRWLNLGPAERGGATIRIAGDDYQAARFDACTRCGVVWTAQRGVDSPADARHRGWCPQRRHPSADQWTSVVLTHHLRTQAVRLLVPPVVLVDPTLLTSFRAALLLGLRVVLGGDPDHLDVIVAADPAPGSVERWAMVLHDRVPGGTGYLARFGEPEEVQRLLRAALDVLAHCPCKDEPVTACHRCLLPHVPPFQATIARRDRAEELLVDILRDWDPMGIESLATIVVAGHDTPIERRFRELLLGWGTKQGAKVTRHATSFGDRAEITFPVVKGGVRWRLDPQVHLGFVVPDFVLTTDDPDVARIAVFCDGVRYHAHADHNRIADDAAKRAELRQQGYVVWSLTHADLDSFADDSPASPAWLGSAAPTAEAVGAQVCGPGDVSVSDLLGDPLTVLTRLLRIPDTDRWQRAAQSVAIALLGPSPTPHLAVPGALAALARADLLQENPVLDAGAAQLFAVSTPGGASLALDVRAVDDVRTVLAVDDRDGVVGTPDHLTAWRDWLALANVLQLMPPGHARTTSLAGLVDDPAGQSTLLADPAWAEIAATYDEPEADFIRLLANTHTPLPEAGLEVADGEHVIDLAWPEEHVAVVFDVDDERATWLAADGWSLVPPTLAAVREALGLEEISG